MFLRFGFLLALAAGILLLCPDSSPPVRAQQPKGAKVTAELVDGSNRVVVVNGTSLSEKAATAEVTAKVVDPAIENECQIKSKTFKWELLGLYWKGGPDDGQPVAKNLYDAKFVQKKPTEPEATFQLRLVKPGRVRAILQITAFWTIAGKTKENDSCKNTQASDILKAETHNGEKVKGLDFIGVQLKLVAVPRVLAADAKHDIPFYFEFVGAYKVKITDADVRVEIRDQTGKNVEAELLYTTPNANAAFNGLFTGDQVRGTPAKNNLQNGDTNAYTIAVPFGKLQELELAPPPKFLRPGEKGYLEVGKSHRTTNATAWVKSFFQVMDLPEQNPTQATSKKVSLSAILDKWIRVYEFDPKPRGTDIETWRPLIEAGHTRARCTLHYLGNTDNNAGGKKPGWYANEGLDPAAPYKKSNSKQWKHFAEPVPIFWNERVERLPQDGFPPPPGKVEGPFSQIPDASTWIDTERKASYDLNGYYEIRNRIDTAKMHAAGDICRPGDRWEQQLTDRQYGVLFVIYFGFKDIRDLAGNLRGVIDITQNDQQIDLVMFDGSKVRFEVDDEQEESSKYWKSKFETASAIFAVTGKACDIVGKSATPATPVGAWATGAGGVFGAASTLAKAIPSVVTLDNDEAVSGARAEMWGGLAITDDLGNPVGGFIYPTVGDDIGGINGGRNTVMVKTPNPKDDGVRNGVLKISKDRTISLTTWKFYHTASTTAYAKQVKRAGFSTNYQSFASVRFYKEIGGSDEVLQVCNIKAPQLKAGQTAKGFWTGE